MSTVLQDNSLEKLQEANERLTAENLQLQTQGHVVERLTAENLQLRAELEWLKEQIGLAKRRLYGAKSEQTHPDQEALVFNEAEATADPDAPEPQVETITFTRKKKQSGQRELQIENLPVEDVFYRMSDEEQVCPRCSGPLHQMGEEVRCEVKLIPAQAKLVRHIRSKYACRHCHQAGLKVSVLTAPMPQPAFPHSLASPSAVAYIMSQKFLEGLPLYRQEMSLRRLGFELSRQTMANWMIAGAGWLEHLYKRMQAHLILRDVLHADETTVQVLHEVGRAPQTTSYMWLYGSGRDGPPIVLYDYQAGRGSEHPRKFLAGFSGRLHVDGYASYEALPAVTLSGCWAHARRKFMDALSTLPADVRNRGGTLAHAGLAFINKLYAIERELKACTPEERLAGRQQQSRPVMALLDMWLAEHATVIAPRSPLGTAMTYCRRQWPKLNTFLTDGRLDIDNNRAERSIKPFVIGRKNWLFANTPRGARASAVIYSIVESAKQNGLDPQRYLAHLFEQLPNVDVKSNQALDLLMPWSEPISQAFTVRTSASE